MTQPDKTLLVFVVDRSGSMASIAKDMIGGFKTLIEEQKKQPGECLVTVTRFDDQYEVVCEQVPVAEVGELELVPRGGTALYDALGRTIVVTGEKLSNMPEEKRPAKILFVVITDGHNNQSVEYSAERVRSLVKEQTETYSWDFTFLGANQDAALAAVDLGIPAAHAVTYDASSKGAGAVVQSFSHQISNYRSAQHNSRGKVLEGSQLAYNAEVDKVSHAVTPDVKQPTLASESEVKS